MRPSTSIEEPRGVMCRGGEGGRCTPMCWRMGPNKIASLPCFGPTRVTHTGVRGQYRTRGRHTAIHGTNHGASWPAALRG